LFCPVQAAISIKQPLSDPLWVVFLLLVVPAPQKLSHTGVKITGQQLQGITVIFGTVPGETTKNNPSKTSFPGFKLRAQIKAFLKPYQTSPVLCGRQFSLFAF